jgi:hypothetical protein
LVDWSEYPVTGLNQTRADRSDPQRYFLLTAP